MDGLWDQIGITWVGVAGVVLATTVMYVVFTAVMGFWGRRLRSSSSLFSLALITLAGSIAARAVLGNAPTLFGGLVALGTLVLLERLLRRVRVQWLVRRRPPAIVVMVAGRPQSDLLKACGMSEAHLWVTLRQAGVHHRDEVALAVVERRGNVTILSRGPLLDAALLRGVVGLERIPEDLLDPATTG